MTRAQQSKEKCRGVFIAAPTPMHDDWLLDLSRTRELIGYYCANRLGPGTAMCTSQYTLDLGVRHGRRVPRTTLCAAERRGSEVVVHSRTSTVPSDSPPVASSAPRSWR
ncbi:hypothetical protein MYX78_04935 [Acidobacteria bacterium AH-259-G07]|nr:hypothetical protein [Acidobacteria bacterium AH-259-G07]